MNDTSHHSEDVALFIDWENFKISLASGSRAPNVSALKEEVSNYGRVVVAKAYADWVTRAPELRGASQFTIDPPALYAAGIEPVYVPTRLPQGGTSSDPTRTFRVKNSVDVKMTADCIECAHSYSNIGTFVLVSGDSDFIHVINALRAMGKRVVIIGVSWSTSRRLADQVDGLILYDTDVDPVTPPEPATPVSNGRSAPRLSSPSKQQLPEVIRTIEDIVRSERQAGRSTLLTSLKQRLMRRIPGFDEKKLGFSGFKKLMQRVEQEGKVKLVTVGLVDWVVLSDEPEVEGVVAESSETRETASEVVNGSEPPVGETEPASDTLIDAKKHPTSSTNGRRKRSKPAEVMEQPQEPLPAPADTSYTVVTDTLKELELPKGPDDGQDAQRVADLIVMADTLEHREGVSHVAFNFLVSEVCNALTQGLEAQHETITQHWGEMHSQNYVTRLLRSLGNSSIFQRGWHTGKDKDTGRRTRRSTFNLNRNHPLVQKVLQDQWNISGSHGSPPEMEPHQDPSEPDDAPPLEPSEGVSLLPEEHAKETEPSTGSGIGRVMRLFSRS
jgi:uncharacterized LabA/DUF88 family protein